MTAEADATRTLGPAENAGVTSEPVLPPAVLVARLEELRRPHSVVDDCFYSCPKSGECCDDDRDEDKCWCGADEHNAKIDALIADMRL